MQLLLPIFPKETKLITSTLGVFEKDDIVYYLHSGVPIANHLKNDLKGFRCHTSRFIDNGLCRQTDIVRTFCVSNESVKKSLKLFQEKGESGFYGQNGAKRLCHTMLPDRLHRIQTMLDKGMSNYAIAKKEGISEGTIRYSLSQGKLKKNHVPTRKK